jgi:hypothetical protein
VYAPESQARLSLEAASASQPMSAIATLHPPRSGHSIPLFDACPPLPAVLARPMTPYSLLSRHRCRQFPGLLDYRSRLANEPDSRMESQTASAATVSGMPIGHPASRKNIAVAGRAVMLAMSLFELSKERSRASLARGLGLDTFSANSRSQGHNLPFGRIEPQNGQNGCLIFPTSRRHCFAS